MPGDKLVSENRLENAAEFELGLHEAACGGDHGGGKGACHPRGRDELGYVGGEAEGDRALGVQLSCNIAAIL